MGKYLLTASGKEALCGHLNKLNSFLKSEYSRTAQNEICEIVLELCKDSKLRECLNTSNKMKSRLYGIRYPFETLANGALSGETVWVQDTALRIGVSLYNRAMTLSEISKKVSRSPATLKNKLEMLEAHGFVERGSLRGSDALR